MFIHNLDPVLIDFGFIAIRWYSLAYIFGIILGWWYGKKIIAEKFLTRDYKFNLKDFDDFITYLVISLIIGGRLGYVIFYNPEFYFSNSSEIIKIWKGGLSFHGALLGVIVGTYIFSVRRKLQAFFLLDIVACVSPIGIFLGRIANFINGELIGKASILPWSVIFPKVDMVPRHPSQLYEALLEGLILFIILNLLILKKDYKIGTCSIIFLITYGILRIISEYFREPDQQIGYLFNSISMGSLLSLFMILFGFVMVVYFKKNEN